MKIAGIIAEYNPFHKGHAYHIEQTRMLTGCDYVAVCMAGSYTQRGEAACLSKWERARMALTCGADAVFELPALFAVRTADVFARGGVGVLDGLGVDVLSFGSEREDPEFLKKVAGIRANEPVAVTEAILKKLAEGKSHARAWGEAVAAYLNVEPEILNAPNVVLGVEYIRAIWERNSRMQIAPVRRLGAYHDDTMDTQGFASATAIRAAMKEDRMSEAVSGVPAETEEILRNADSMHDPDDLLLHILRGMSETEIAALPDVAEGLERRVKRCAQEAGTRQELIEMLKCKRYTWARLSRLTAHALLGLTTDLTQRHPVPEYARLIGMRKDAKPLMKELKQRTTLPIISDAIKLADNEIFQLECRATDLRALQCESVVERRSAQEFTRKFVIV